MKTFKKMMALMIAMVMVLGMSVSVFAQTVPESSTQQNGKGQITITNASKGETYKVIKLFSASVTGNEDGSVRYTGTIPGALATYYVQDAAGNISATKAAYSTITYYTDAGKTTEADTETNYWTGEGMSEGLKEDLKTYADDNNVAGTVSDGSTLYFNNLDYGYYIVCTTQGQGIVTVDTTNPTATVNDKNTTLPVKDLTKAADEDDEEVSIGDRITYTVTFATANYDGTDQIDRYVITDTLPAFLGNVVVTSLKVIEVPAQVAVEDDPETMVDEGKPAVQEQSTSLDVSQYQFDNDGKIEITWARSSQNLYKNGSVIELVYEATVTSDIVAGNVASNANKVTVQAYSGNDVTENGQDEETEIIKTYAAALQKTDETGAELAGATFQVPGLTVTGSGGNYVVESYDPTINTAGTIMECDPTGFLVIRGISDDDINGGITIYEVDAPNGYNKLTEGVTLPVVQTSLATTTSVSQTTTTTYFDSLGNVVGYAVEGGSSQTVVYGEISTNADLVNGALTVQNQKGAELPSTGGIGTTIFYIVGTILVIGAGVVLISRKRMAAR